MNHLLPQVVFCFVLFFNELCNKTPIFYWKVFACIPLFCLFSPFFFKFKKFTILDTLFKLISVHHQYYNSRYTYLYFMSLLKFHYEVYNYLHTRSFHSYYFQENPAPLFSHAQNIHPCNLAFGCIKMNFLWMKPEQNTQALKVWLFPCLSITEIYMKKQIAPHRNI